jgi:hypothetical protein
MYRRHDETWSVTAPTRAGGGVWNLLVNRCGSKGRPIRRVSDGAVDGDGRDIPVAFLAGGPHAVCPLDAVDARPGCQQLAGGGSRHANPCWEAHFRGRACGAAHTACTPIRSRAAADNGETFLSGELPNWLAANKGLTPGGHGVVRALSLCGYFFMATDTVRRASVPR